MKVLWWSATALAFVAAVSLSPAMAGGAKTSGGNTWPGVGHRVVPSSPSAAATSAHYEWRSGYDHHANWRGHWVPSRDGQLNWRISMGPAEVLVGARRAR